MNGPGTARFEADLSRISRNLRLRFDRLKYRFIIEQRDSSGRWCLNEVLQTPQRGFRKPNRSDLRWRKIADCRRFLLNGKQNWYAWDRFIQKEFEDDKEDEDLRKSKLFQPANEAFRDQMAWFYRRNWQKLPKYSRKQIADAKRAAEARLEAAQ